MTDETPLVFGPQHQGVVTPRQFLVLEEIMRGRPAELIGKKLGISVASVSGQIHRMLKRTGALDRAHLVTWAYESGTVLPGWAVGQIEPPVPEWTVAPPARRYTPRGGETVTLGTTLFDEHEADRAWLADLALVKARRPRGGELHAHPGHLYVTLARKLAHSIARSVLQPGDWLPAENDLAEKYDISPMTARTSFKCLREAGLVVTIRGSGHYVATIPDVAKQARRWLDDHNDNHAAKDE